MLGKRESMAAIVALAASLFCVGAAMLGCDRSESTDLSIERLRIGLLPGESKAALEHQFSPLRDYLEQELGVPCQLVFSDSYEDLQSDVENQDVEIAWLGGYLFVNVNRSHDTVPLVSRDTDLRFTSYFLVQADETANELADFRDQRFAFGSRLSTSGHLMPRHFLQSWEIDPDTFFGAVRYTGAHDKTAFAVRDGEVDIGVANAATVDAMFSSGQLSNEDVRILRETPPFVDYVWACQANLPSEFQIKLRDAFLNLVPLNPSHETILSRLRAKYFVPVSASEFRELQSIVDALAMAETAQ